MRSILALGLALLVLASEAPGIFIESPVCAAVDGREAVARDASAKSCCGTASCPMHTAEPCAMKAGCTETRTDAKSTKARLCAPSCGREGARVVPGVPDPGTLDTSTAPGKPLDASAATQVTTGDLPARNPVPTVPPPRA